MTPTNHNTGILRILLASYFPRSLELEGIGNLTAFPGHGSRIANLEMQAGKIEAHLRSELEAVARQLDDHPKTAFELSNSAKDMRKRAFPAWLSVTQTLVYLNHLIFEERAETLETDRGLMYRRIPSTTAGARG